MIDLEKSTFRKHLIYSSIEGLIIGVLALNEFVFIKTMKGSEFGLGFLFQFSVIVLLVSVFINEYLKRFRNKKKILVYITLMTRLPLLLFLLFPADFNTVYNTSVYHLVFLCIFLIYFLSQPVVLPIINLFLKNNYRSRNFGKYYSYSETFRKGFAIIATFLFGLLLDYDKDAYIFVYPFLGLLSIFSVWILGQIDTSKMELDSHKMKIHISLRTTFMRTIEILKTDKAYRDFEIGFMFYGLAFMITAVVFTLFFDKVLHLNYSSLAFYKNYYNLLAIILLPFFGKLIDKIDPRKFGVLSFSFLSATIFFVMMTEFVADNIEIWGIKIYFLMLIAYSFYGFFAATMALLWFIGSAYFAHKKNADIYQAAHLSLTGARGVFAPFVGVLILQYSNYSITFGIAFIASLISVFVMYWSLRKEKRKQPNHGDLSV